MPSNSRHIIAPADPGPVPELVDARVAKVFDGDGFLADIWTPDHGSWVKGIPFRFAFIDAPEMDQQHGPEAQAFLQRLIDGETLKLALVSKQSAEHLPFDSYRRVLCMGYLTAEMGVGDISYYLDGESRTGVVKRARPVTRNVELEMIANGWAWVVERWSFDREDEYFAAQEDAKRHRRGLWAADDPMPPWKFKAQQERRRRTTAQQLRLL